MPIDLTLSESSGEHRSHRSRRRSRHRQRRQLTLAVAGGIGLILVLCGVLYLSNPSLFARKVDPSTGLGKPNLVMPGDPIPIEKAMSPPTATSAEATSSDDAAGQTRRVTIHSVRRVKAGNATDLQVDYEFLNGAASPENYYIAVQTPEGKGYSAFDPKAVKRDVVQISLEIKRLSGRGPIIVWIETRIGNERVSNVQTLP